MLRVLTLLGVLIWTVVLFTQPTTAEDKKTDQGFVQLFNGKDLKGWKTHPDDKATWEVKEGILTGRGPAGHLFTERDDYENFTFRIEAKINDQGNSGQYCRVRFSKAFPKGYEAQINSTHKDPLKTGSLWGFGEKAAVKEILVQPDTWFTQEVTLVGNRITIKVNDKTTVDFVDEKNTYTKGCLALQQHDPKSVVQFRKLEVKELPAK